MKVKDIVHGYDLGACILAVLCILPSAVVIYMLDPLTRDSILKRAVVGLVAFLGTVLLVPTIARFTERKGLFGRDLGKRHVPSLQNVPVPEALGIVSSLSFMVSVILCQVAFASTFEEKANYNSALTSVCFMVLLGRMGPEQTFQPKHAITLQNKDDLSIPRCWGRGAGRLLLKSRRRKSSWAASRFSRGHGFSAKEAGAKVQFGT